MSIEPAKQEESLGFVRVRVPSCPTCKVRMYVASSRRIGRTDSAVRFWKCRKCGATDKTTGAARPLNVTAK